MDHFGANQFSDRVNIREVQLQPLEIQPQEESKSCRGFIRRKLDQLYDTISSINDNVNKSTFGRVFRLKGSGHVRSTR